MMPEKLKWENQQKSLKVLVASDDNKIEIEINGMVEIISLKIHPSILVEYLQQILPAYINRAIK